VMRDEIGFEVRRLISQLFTNGFSIGFDAW
jgi:hypothetical protein